ncbi:MAG: threonine--tRNA ligase, partial [Bacteroidetes bacterium]|nr:threonine--tRNA ligase [Bacteroidota bacterium]
MSAESIKLTFPDGAEREYANGITALEIAKGISNSLARVVIGAVLNDQQIELSRPITTNGTFTLVKWDDTAGKQMFWHSSAHLMAEAMQELYPNVKFGIGPSIETGFYYDVDLGGQKISEDDLPAIEKKMKELAQKKSEFKWYLVPKAEAIEYFTKKDDQYKLELLQNLQDGDISFVEHGNFVDLCRGGHIPDTGHIKAIKLLNVAGAYWRGDEKNQMLTRIYGVTFPKQTMLDEHLELLEEAKKRDHRKIGKELGLFTFSQKVGLGLPLWQPKGTELRERLEGFMRAAQKKEGYTPVITPHIGSKELYVTSGHYEKYGADSFQPIKTPNENEEFLLKPMNCPHHCELYKSQPRSYRDLPLRLSEFGTVYRYEQHGELHGLTRVRGFTQDDAHIFCTAEQVKEEFKKVIDLVLHVFGSLGFEDYTAQISLRHKTDRSKYIGSEENWEKAEKAIIE